MRQPVKPAASRLPRQAIDSFDGLQKHFAHLRMTPRDIQQAVRWVRQQAKTKTKVTALGLKELIRRHKLEQLRALRGCVMLDLNIAKSRKRQFSPQRD